MLLTYYYKVYTYHFQQLFVQFQRGQKFEMSVPTWWVMRAIFLVYRQQSLCCILTRQTERALVSPSPNKGTSSHQGDSTCKTSSKSHFLPIDTSPPNTITLGIRTTYGFQKDSNVQSIAHTITTSLYDFCFAIALSWLNYVYK